MNRYNDMDVNLVIECAKKSAWKFSNGNYERYEDYYSVGLIGATKAIKTYNKNNDVLLKTYAYKCIRNEILMYIGKKSLIADFYLDDTLINDSEPLYLKEILKSDVNIENEVIYDDLLNNIYENINTIFTPSEYRILKTLIDYPNRSQQELADILNCSRQYVSSITQKLKIKVNTLIYNE